MDSVSLTVQVAHDIQLSEDNGSLNPTRFAQGRETSAGYGTVGTSAGSIDRIYYDEIVLDKSGSTTIALTSLPIEPAGVGSGGAIATLTELFLELRPNASSTITASGVRLGDATGTGMAKMMFGSVSTTVDVHKTPGVFFWASDTGVARGGDSIKITNLDSSNTVTLNLLLTGRSA